MADIKGKSIIVCAPSGAGKTTIVHHLLKTFPELAFSVSATSRSPRGNEKAGVDYHFLKPGEFENKIDAGEFLEWEEVYPGRYYGTLKTEPERIWKAGKHVIFDLDVLGGTNLKSYLGEHTLAVFVQPPSLEILEVRLRNRSTETEESLNQRLAKAEKEMTYNDKFDQVIINDDLSKACRDAEDLVRSFLNS